MWKYLLGIVFGAVVGLGLMAFTGALVLQHLQSGNTPLSRFGTLGVSAYVVGFLVGLWIFVAGVFGGIIGAIRTPIEARRQREQARINAINQQQWQQQRVVEQAAAEKRMQEAKKQHQVELRSDAIKRLARRHPTTDPSQFTSFAIQAEIEAIENEEENAVFQAQVAAVQEQDARINAKKQQNFEALSRAAQSRRKITIRVEGEEYPITGYVSSLSQDSVSIADDRGNSNHWLDSIKSIQYS
ncbi:MAG: hypothetical protein KF716_07410 [Anaerolineae bacterium]|nr:hypothetical protein [Anaerolineae bacterium]